MSNPSDRLTAPLAVRPLRPAYEQVADQLRELILSGQLRVGDRLPTEPELCAQFGTSRSTIREALKLLASQHLINTRRGAGGGSNVIAPAPEQVVDFLSTTLMLLAGTGELNARELLEARRMLEVPAAGSVAAERGAGSLDALRAQIPPSALEVGRQELFVMNRSFHQMIIIATGNRVLPLMADPIFSILQSRFLVPRATTELHQQIIVEHHEILDAIASGDRAAAEHAMDTHLCHLEPVYTREDQLASEEDDAS